MAVDRAPLPRLGIAKTLALAVCIGFAVASVLSNVISWDLEDMDAYWNAALRLRHGLPLYPALSDPGAADVYRYAPWFAWIWVHLTGLPKDLVQAVWSAVLVISIPFAIAPLVRHPSAAAVCVAALLGGLLFKTASTGNVHALVIAVLVVGAARRSGPIWVGLAASLKVVPIALVLVYAGRGEWWRAVLALGVTVALAAPAVLYDLRNYPPSSGGSFSILSQIGIVPFVSSAVVAMAAAVALARTRFAWLAASLSAVLLLPRLDFYGLTYLLVGLGSPSKNPDQFPQAEPPP